MDSAVKLINAIANLLGAIAWPIAIAVVAIYVLRRHREAVDGVFGRAKIIGLPGGAQIELFEKVHQQHEQLLETANRAADASPSERRTAIEQLVEQAARHGEIQKLVTFATDERQLMVARRLVLRKLINEYGFPESILTPTGGNWFRAAVREQMERDEDDRPIA